MGFLEGKRALIAGVASNRSIAWGVANAMREQGAELAFTYQNERLGERVRKFASELDSELALECDVSEDASIDKMYAELGQAWDGFDILVHSLAFAPRESLAGEFLEGLDRESFRIAHDVSAYSLAAMAKGARPLMQGRAGALLSLTYLGAVRVLPNYNVMGPAKASLEATIRYLAENLGPEGIRVNGVSAGPIRTLAASGIGDFRKLLEHVEHSSPLRRNVTIQEVGNVAAFMCSDLASGITGEITYVDAGYSIKGSGPL